MANKEIFVSYKHESGVDKFVTKLVSDLEASGFTVWRDETGIRAGENWLESIGMF